LSITKKLKSKNREKTFSFKLLFLTFNFLDDGIIREMEIWYLDHSSFRIRSQEGIIITDPYGPEIGLKLPKIKADIITVSHELSDHNRFDLSTGRPFVIRTPGEYEIQGISVFGIPSFHKNIIYLIETEGIKLCHLGNLDHQLEKEALNKINSPDVLFVPVGNRDTIGPKEIIKIIRQIEPKIVIPMHYRNEELKVKEFLRALDVKATPIPKLTIKKTDLIFEGEKVVVLERRKN